MAFEFSVSSGTLQWLCCTKDFQRLSINFQSTVFRRLKKLSLLILSWATELVWRIAWETHFGLNFQGQGILVQSWIWAFLDRLEKWWRGEGRGSTIHNTLLAMFIRVYLRLFLSILASHFFFAFLNDGRCAKHSEPSTHCNWKNEIEWAPCVIRHLVALVPLQFWLTRMLVQSGQSSALGSGGIKSLSPRGSV